MSLAEEAPTTVTAILTAHNRVRHTRACLANFLHQALAGPVRLAVVMVDDGCTDGTSDMVRSEYPEVTLVAGSGDLFWAGGMALAQRVAVRGNPDYLLWLNDDIELEPRALSVLLDIARRAPSPCIVTGAMRRSAGEISYSGLIRNRIRTRLDYVPPSDQPQRIHAFHGNLVLVPREIYQRIGGVEPGFKHAYGDLDYGLRATEQGFGCLLAPGYLGVCEPNNREGTWLDPALPRIDRIRLMLHVKGRPLGPHLLFLRRHGGALWPAWAALSYARSISKILRRR
jgi:GT2 family glycosyltransferase